MANPIITPNINIQNGGQEQSMAGSSAMVVSGLNKELKPNKANVAINDPKVNLKQLEEYIQKLTHSSPIDEIKKHEEKNRKRQKQKEKQRRLKVVFFDRTPAEPFEWQAEKQETGNFLADLFLYFQQKVLKRALNFALQPGLVDLIKLGQEMKIDLKSWNLEKFIIAPDGQIILPSGLSEEERRYLLLREEFRILEIGEILEENWANLIIIKLRKHYVLNTLRSLKMKKEEIEKIRSAAKQIAWLKLITELKALHLKRVFSGSKKDFDFYSEVISCYTQKIRKIDVAISEEGFNWVKTRLKQLAVDTAKYKLELLRSMQKLNFDKSREKEITWLSKFCGPEV